MKKKKIPRICQAGVTKISSSRANIVDERRHRASEYIHTFTVQKAITSIPIALYNLEDVWRAL